MKGHTNNPHGRPAGKPNKLTKELRKILKSVIEAEIERIPAIIQAMPDKDRLEILFKLLPYVLPKVESVSMNHGEPLDFGLDDFNQTI